MSKVKDIEEFIATALMVPRHNPHSPSCIWGLPLNIVGLSGAGKTERIEAACRRAGLVPQTVLPSGLTPEDFGGAPFATPDGIVMECILPAAVKLINIGSGVFFIDELSTARPAVQAAALGAVDSRKIGSHVLPPKVRIITAMNPPEYAAGGFEISPPLANRMGHVEYEVPSVTAWSDWLLRDAPDVPNQPSLSEETVRQGWGRHWSAVRGLLIGFMRGVGVDMLHKQPKYDDPNGGGAWPSHRMWNWAGRAIATTRCLGMPDYLEEEFIVACVGEGVREAWVEWVHAANLPDPETMLNKGWVPDPERLDITIAALTSMAGWLTSIANQHDGTGEVQRQRELAVKAWPLLEATFDVGMPDLAVSPASKLVTAGLANGSNIESLTKASVGLIKKLGKGGFSGFAADVANV